MKKIYTLLLLITFFNLSAQVPNYVSTDGLVGWWPFNGNANEENIGSNNGIINGATLTTDRFGNINKAYLFNGINNNIQLAPINTKNSISLSCWVLNQRVSTDGEWKGLVTNQDNNTQGFLLQDNQNMRYDFTVSNGSGYFDLYSNTLIKRNIWTHIVCIIETDSMKIYVNGDLENSISLGTYVLESNANLFFGSRFSNEFYKGKLDDIGIWNRTLDSTEINQLYTGTVSQDICTYFDTISVYDTIAVYDTLTYYDTVQIAVTDTLIIDILLTGVAQPNNAKTIKVYPNPAKNVVIIDNGDYSALNNYRLKIINSLGQEVFDSSINIPQFQIPVSVLGTVGLYYIKVFDDNNSLLETKKLILK